MKKILVPVDFSEYSEYAVNLAVDIARMTGAAIDLVHSFHTTIEWVKLPKEKEKDYPETRHEINVANNRLAEWAHRSEYSDVQVDKQLYFDVDYKAILRHCQNEAADLIVIGSHGTGGFNRLFLGSTVLKIIRMADCPVMAVNKPASAEALKKVVFASDFEEDVQEPFRKVAEFAKAVNGRVNMLKILTPLQEDNDRIETEQFRKLDTSAYQHVETIHIRSHQTIPDGILSYAKDSGAGLIAIPTHGREGVSRLLHWGSIAEQLVNKSDIPVFTIRL